MQMKLPVQKPLDKKVQAQEACTQPQQIAQVLYVWQVKVSEMQWESTAKLGMKVENESTTEPTSSMPNC